MKPYTQLLIAVAIIGISPILGRLGSTIIEPALFSFYDMITGFIILSFVLKINKPKKFRGIIKYLTAGGLFFSFGVIFYYTSLSITSSVNVSFLSQFQLIMTIIFSFFILKEKPTKYKLIGAAIVFAGGLFIIYQENINLSDGWVYALIAFLLYTFVNIFTKILRGKNIDARTILFFYYGIVSIFLLSYINILGIKLILNMGIIYAMINGAVADVIGWVLFNDAIKKVELSRAFMVFSISPLFTLIYSLFIFQSGITIFQVFGGTLLISGNILANKKSKKIV